MNQKSFAIAAVLMTAALTGVFATSPMAYADESETSTDQENESKNIGSGDAFVCSVQNNLIQAGADETDCEAATAVSGEDDLTTEVEEAEGAEAEEAEGAEEEEEAEDAEEDTAEAAMADFEEMITAD